MIHKMVGVKLLPSRVGIAINKISSIRGVF